LPKASESVKFLAGDCDDHAIMMVAAIKSIGGTARFVATTGHLYPEILIGDKFDLPRLRILLRMFFSQLKVKDQSLHYHTDPDGKYG
jgi:hypothetical protein